MSKYDSCRRVNSKHCDAAKTGISPTSGVSYLARTLTPAAKEAVNDGPVPPRLQQDHVAVQ
jgi:hypothetical protein